MIVLDTNVISEVMLPAPSPVMLAWLRAIPISELATTTICLAEIGYGLSRLPAGRRRNNRETRFNTYRSQVLGSRIFSFDGLAADTYGALVAERERSGRPIRGPDGYIAAIAVSRGLAIATRDTRGFEGCGLELVNPWAD